MVSEVSVYNIGMVSWERIMIHLNIVIKRKKTVEKVGSWFESVRVRRDLKMAVVCADS